MPFISVGNNEPNTTYGPYLATGANGTFSVQGTFGGATVDLQYVVPGGTTQAAFDTATTATAAVNERFECAAGVSLYIVLSSAGALTDLDVFLSGAI